jgi:hypothetical protein
MSLPHWLWLLMGILSDCALRLIRWETLKSNFQKWQNGAHGEPQRRPDIRQSGLVREHPRSQFAV